MRAQAVRPVAVFDGLLRLIHAWNGLSILALIATSLLADAFEHDRQGAALWRLHIQFGYALIGGLVARAIWGLIGPATARWSDLWHPREWLAMLGALPRLRLPAWRRGHDTLASALFLTLYLALAGLAVTGLALAAIKHNAGPLTEWLGDSIWLKHLFKQPHEALYAVVASFVLLHLAALIWHQLHGNTPAAQAMITGIQYSTQGDDHA